MEDLVPSKLLVPGDSPRSRPPAPQQGEECFRVEYSPRWGRSGVAERDLQFGEVGVEGRGRG